MWYRLNLAVTSLHKNIYRLWSEVNELESALNESNELLAIFTSIGKNLNL